MKNAWTKPFLVFIVLVTVALAIVVGLIYGGVIKVDIKDSESPAPPTGTASPTPTPTPTIDLDADVYRASFGAHRFGGVSADNYDCSRIGTDIMAKGGSSVDIMVAVGICVGVVGMESSGIGGGDFITIYDVAKGDTERKMVAINAREVAPLAATADMFVDNSIDSVLGGKAIAVPGELMGFYEACQRYCHLPWKDLVMPSVKLARDGFTVSWELATAIEYGNQLFPNYEGPLVKNLRSDVMARGYPLKEGDYMKRPLYAHTLEVVANEGPLAFYNGSLAEDIVADIQEAGGIITLQDLADYRVDWVEPIHTELQNANLTVYSLPPPSSGAVLQYILNIIDEYAMTSDDLSTPEKEALTYHRMIEAFKFAYGQRSALGDAQFVDTAEIVANLTSDEFAKETRDLINDLKTLAFEEYRPAFHLVNDGGTSQVSVITPKGTASSITATVNYYLGSLVVGSRTGILFNNEMDDFSTPGTSNLFGVPASVTNFIEPGKRPMSSMSPSIVLNGNKEPVLAMGASGGTRIITAIATTMIRLLFLGQKLDDATSAPRFHHQLLPDVLEISDRFSQATQDALTSKGHKVNIREENEGQLSGWFGNVQAVQNTCDACTGDVMTCPATCVHAVADYRKRGMPDGY